MVFWTNREASTSFQQLDSGLRWDSTPWVSHPDKTNPPPGADFSISPQGIIINIIMRSRVAHNMQGSESDSPGYKEGWGHAKFAGLSRSVGGFVVGTGVAYEIQFVGKDAVSVNPETQAPFS